MDDIIVWIIIVGFYAPLHYLVPQLVLFMTGNDTTEQRRKRVRRALIDSSWSMVLAFALVIPLTRQQLMLPAMLILLLSMTLPLIRIWRVRIKVDSDG